MSRPALDVLGIGENSVDIVYRIPDAVAPNAKLAATARRVSCGGQVATTVAACAALGLRSAYVGTFGSDENGRRVREALAARGVDIAACPLRVAPNREAVILVDERNGDRTVVWHRDARLALRPDEVPRGLIASARLLHVDDLDESASIAAAAAAVAAGVPVTSDIDRVTDRTRELMSLTTVAIFSARALSRLTGDDDPARALRALRRDHPGWLCVTRGTSGAWLLDGDHLHHVAARPVQAVDTTGAGDVFRGAFIHALLAGRRPEHVLQWAATAAAVSCTREGAIDSIPELRDLERLSC